MANRYCARLVVLFYQIGGICLISGGLAGAAIAQDGQLPARGTPPEEEITDFAVARPQRLPVPSDDQLAAARVNAKDTYAIRMRSARTRADRAGLAQLMLQDAATGSTSPEVLYARLELARDTAAGALAFGTALEAVDRMGAKFNIATNKTKASLLWTMTRGGITPEERVSAARSALSIVGAVSREADFNTAHKLVEFAIDQSRRAREVELTRQAVAMGKRVQAIEQAASEVDTYRATLREAPGDREANLWMGNYLCLIQREWGLGVTYWALGGDPQLAALAQRELTDPTEAAEFLALGDSYYRNASRFKDLENESMLHRAGHWYRQALRGAVARADRERITKRLEEIPEDVFGTEEKDVAFTGWGTRGQTARTVLARQYGGTPESEAAVARALKWIALHQSADGSWNFDHRAGECRARCGNAGDSTSATTGATALALLPLLAAGNTHQSGVYKQNVQSGLRYLVQSIQVGNNGGSLRGKDTSDGPGAYSHALATMALCEAYGMTQDRDLLAPCRLALTYSIYCQDPTGGGWRYRPRQAGDTSVTGWHLTALHLGQQAGALTMPPQVAAGATAFLNAMQSDNGAAYGYTETGSKNPMSAAGLLCRLHLGWRRDHDAIQRGCERLANTGPSHSNLYYNYYATQVLFQHTRGQGPMWEAWNSRLRDSLIQRQAVDDHSEGSWYIGNQGTDKGGRLYCTSLATLCLQIYYRYPLSPEGP